jgi:hypothetical protein
MFLPENLVWLEAVIIAAIIVFVIDLLGNTLAFGGRLVNAFATAAIFFVVFAILTYFGFGKMEFATDAAEIPSRFLPGGIMWLEPVIIATVVVFAVGFLGNVLAFDDRIMNALVTAVIFLVIFGLVTYLGYGNIDVDVSTTATMDAPANE